MASSSQFPRDFLWGAGTSSHQVEGKTRNDWSEWEKQNADRLASESSSQFFAKTPQWNLFQKQAFDPKNYISDKSCDHYQRFEEDFDIAKSLNHNAHRFSIEWSRIEPKEGVFDTAAIGHYRQVLRALKQRNITPMVTLWHWTLPLWLAKKGGLTHRNFPEHFARYAETIAQELGNDAHFWITLNEPLVIASHAYLKGAWPPQKKSCAAFLQAVFHLIRAHKKAYAAFKKISPEAQIGIAKHQVVFEIARDTFLNRFLQKTAHFWWNRWFLNRIKKSQDFIGLNHYNRNVIDNGFGKNPNERVTDFGWEFHPQSLTQALLDLKPYQKPVYVTENGVADASDSFRAEFLFKAIESLKQARENGVDVRGYFHWSLLDNFEWDKGFWLRFGLVSVDYTTQKRAVRQSALAYADLIRENTVSE